MRLGIYGRSIDIESKDTCGCWERQDKAVVMGESKAVIVGVEA
jgi:hypothetical protein